MPAKTRPTFKTVDALLSLAEQFHRDLEQRYAVNEDRLTGRRQRMLLAALDRRERHMLSLVTGYRRRASKKVRGTYFQYIPAAADDLETINDWTLPHHAEIDDIMAAVFEFDSTIQDYYQQAATLAPSAPVRDLFASLADAIAEKKRAESQSAVWSRDI